MLYDLILKTKRLVKMFFCRHQYEYFEVKSVMGFKEFHYYKCPKCGRRREEMP